MSLKNPLIFAYTYSVGTHERASGEAWARVLLRADGVPTACWTRRILKHYLQARHKTERAADQPPGRGQQVQQRMMQSYLEAATEAARGAAVIYVDNHML